MNSKSILLTLLSILALTFTYLAIYPTHLEGYATTSFSANIQVASIQVSGSTIDFNHSIQEQIAIANGSNINLTIPVTYTGTDIGIIAASIPTGYEFAQGWYVIENGIQKNVISNSTQLVWTANYTANNVTLHCVTPPPTIIIINMTNSTTQYLKTIKVSSDVHYTNAKASVTINENYPYYRLYLKENGLIDVTQTYNL